jgi:hypothetical protein
MGGGLMSMGVNISVHTAPAVRSGVIINITTAPTAVQIWTEGIRMYESPIKIIESTTDSLMKAIIKQRDDAIFAEIQSSFGVALDREELIRALQYDRDQYHKGYADGKRDAMEELVRCKDCEHWKHMEEGLGDCTHPRFHLAGHADPTTNWNDFCSCGERKDNGI